MIVLFYYLGIILLFYGVCYYSINQFLYVVFDIQVTFDVYLIGIKWSH